MVLLDVVRPDIGLAVWAREPGGSWLRDMDTLRRSGAGVVHADAAPGEVARTLSAQRSPGLPAWLDQDVTWLAGLPSVLAASPRLLASFGFPAVAGGSPDGLQLSCRYGGDARGWRHACGNGRSAPGGAVDPFAVAVLKGGRGPAPCHGAIRLDADAAPDECPVLTIKPSRES